MTTTEDSDSTRGRESKVARLIEEYELQGIGAELEALWTDDDPENRMSLRALADLFNKQLLQSAMERAGNQPLDGEVDNVYRLLNDESTSRADQTRTRRQLERDGLDVAALEEDFVSYQSIRTYLTKHRDADYDRSTNRTDSVSESIQRLQSRVQNVTGSKLRRLKNAGEISLGSFRVLVDIRIVCEDCGVQKDLTTLLDGGGCECG